MYTESQKNHLLIHQTLIRHSFTGRLSTTRNSAADKHRVSCACLSICWSCTCNAQNIV